MRLLSCSACPLYAVKRQERQLRAQLQLQQGEESESDDSDEEERGSGWGAKKGAYYEQGEVSAVQPSCFSFKPL